ncbi:MAG: NUDIX hydrolase [Theionarchaea archaeon]|nr:NUDIX hydrolase [Theionarchaea archaeon]
MSRNWRKFNSKLMKIGELYLSTDFIEHCDEKLEETDKALNTFVAQQEYSHPLVGIIIFIDKKGKVALFNQNRMWRLPERFPRGDEYLEDAIQRTLSNYCMGGKPKIDSCMLLSGREYREDVYQFNYIIKARMSESEPELPNITWVSKKKDLNTCGCVYPHHKTLLEKYFSKTLKDKDNLPFNPLNRAKADDRRLGHTRGIRAKRVSCFPMPSLTVDGLLLKFSESLKFEGIILERRSYTCKREPGKWAFPAGFIEAQETVAEALAREVYEEIGIILEEDQILAVHKFGTGPYRDPRYFVWTQFLVAYTTKEDFKIDPIEIAEVRVFSPATIPYDEMAFDHGSVLREFMTSLPYYIKCVKNKP